MPVRCQLTYLFPILLSMWPWELSCSAKSPKLWRDLDLIHLYRDCLSGEKATGRCTLCVVLLTHSHARRNQASVGKVVFIQLYMKQIFRFTWLSDSINCTECIAEFVSNRYYYEIKSYISQETFKYNMKARQNLNVIFHSKTRPHSEIPRQSYRSYLCPGRLLRPFNKFVVTESAHGRDFVSWCFFPSQFIVAF